MADQLIRRLVGGAEARGIVAEQLDDAVHDAASALASTINNQGLSAQLAFLIDQWGDAAAERFLDQLPGAPPPAAAPAAAREDESRDTP